MISVCIITKNEEKHLEQCLKRFLNKGVELVVVDTGSTDNSVKVAKKYTQAVYDFEWCDDFSAARNFAAQKASNDHILMIDTDEYLVECRINQLERFLNENPKSTGRIERVNEYFLNGMQMYSTDRVSRLYDRRFFYYTGKIHEQLTSINEEPFNAKSIPLKVEHYGYNGNENERKIKAERNYKLLKAELEENPSDTYLMYQIGKNYFYVADYNGAAEYFEKALEYDLNTHLEYVSEMIILYGYSLINTQQVQKAMGLKALYDDYANSADYLFVMALIYMKNTMFDKAVETFLEATKCKNGMVEGVNSYAAFYNIGVIYECLGDKRNALKYYSKCGNYKPAKEGKKRCR